MRAAHFRHSERKSRTPAAPRLPDATGPVYLRRDDRNQLRRSLVNWSHHNKRELAWRHTRDPYRILVSEIMLQQTTVAAVVSYYNRWLRRFPTLRVLARASESDVLHAWQGLGYYARARNLHRSAQISVERFRGCLPEDVSELRTLPGVGRYTANAIGLFAFGQSLPLVEANSARVLARLFNIQDSIDSAWGREKLWNASARLMPKKAGAPDFQSAMMDLGALICVPRAPRCGICPIKKFCAAPDPKSLPLKRSRPPSVSLVESHAFIRRRREILLEQCRRRWRGMWMLPTLAAQKVDPLHTLRFPFTHHEITLRLFQANARRAKPHERWFPLSELSKLPIPSPHRRALALLRPRLRLE